MTSSNTTSPPFPSLHNEIPAPHTDSEGNDGERAMDQSWKTHVFSDYDLFADVGCPVAARSNLCSEVQSRDLWRCYVGIFSDACVTCWTMSGQQGNYSFPPMLFSDGVGTSLLFVVKPCKDKETLRAMIEVCAPTFVFWWIVILIFVVCTVNVMFGVVSGRFFLMWTCFLSSFIKLAVTQLGLQQNSAGSIMHTRMGDAKGKKTKNWI